MTERSVLTLIDRKKRGEAHGPGEIRWLCEAFLDGTVPDYQMAAWLMAVVFRGLGGEETVALTRAMVESGERLEWPGDRPVVDKHSTGGVGDKISLALVPLVASAGVTFVKMSGRGLGHTGGTLDKLESIPGMRIDLPLEEIRRQADRIGCALVGQTPSLAPADGLIYALRDATGTVDSIPLIASSVMSKKLAMGARAVVLDVKYGSGALVAGRESAEELARTMLAIGRREGIRMRAALTPMDSPLGSAVGNALEVAEAIEVLRGGGPEDVVDLTLALGAHLMVISGCTPSFNDAREGLCRLLSGGLALEKFGQLIESQGGDARVIDAPERLPQAPHQVVVTADRAGWVIAIGARSVAQAVIDLGGARRLKGGAIDHRTGVRLLVRIGQRVEVGQPLAELHVAEVGGEREARRAIQEAIGLADDPITGLDVELTVLDSEENPVSRVRGG